MSQQENNRLSRPAVVIALAVVCNLLWGSAIPFINVGYRLFLLEGTASRILFAGCRFTLAGLLTLIFTSITRKKVVLPKPQSLRYVVALSMTQTIIQYALFYVGVGNTSSVKGSLIQGLNAFVTILVACYFFRSERMNGMKWIGGVVGFLGILAVNLGGGSVDASFRLLGEGCLVGSMVSSAFSTGLVKRFSDKDDPVALCGSQFALGGVVLIAIGLLTGGVLRPVSVLAFVDLLYLAMLSAVAYSLWALLLKYNPVSSIAIYQFLQPVFGVLLGLMLFGNADISMVRCAISLMLVCLSIVIVQRGQNTK